MKLYILRHGDAGEAGDPRYKDAERPLTTKGIQRTKQLAHAIQVDLVGDVIKQQSVKRAPAGIHSS